MLLDWVACRCCLACCLARVFVLPYPGLVRQPVTGGQGGKGCCRGAAGTGKPGPGLGRSFLKIEVHDFYEYIFVFVPRTTVASPFVCPHSKLPHTLLPKTAHLNRPSVKPHSRFTQRQRTSSSSAPHQTNGSSRAISLALPKMQHPTLSLPAPVRL